jgi:two-component system, NtrC family, sensor kinase
MSLGAEQEQLLELQRQATVGRLLAGVAHEMSTPVGSIVSNVDALSRLFDQLETAFPEPAPARVAALLQAGRELARIDRDAAERLSRMVRSLKISARVGAAEPQSANVNEIVESALQLARANFRSRIVVEADPGEAGEIECYPHLLSQAILNLLTNAGHAIEATGRITAGARREGDCAHIWVTDTGHGIREEDKPKILTREFTTKPLGVGTGLGLMIVRQIIVKEHGGSITFESQRDRGTRFDVRIPVRQRKEGA